MFTKSAGVACGVGASLGVGEAGLRCTSCHPRPPSSIRPVSRERLWASPALSPRLQCAGRCPAGRSWAGRWGWPSPGRGGAEGLSLELGLLPSAPCDPEFLREWQRSHLSEHLYQPPTVPSLTRRSCSCGSWRSRRFTRPPNHHSQVHVSRLLLPGELEKRLLPNPPHNWPFSSVSPV